MSNKKEELLPWEQEEQINEDVPTRIYKFKCKVVYNFQSIEFDYEGTPADIPDMMSVYKQCLDELMLVSVDQPKAVAVKPKDEQASDKQRDILDKLQIEYDPKNISRKKASYLITNFYKGE